MSKEKDVNIQKLPLSALNPAKYNPRKKLKAGDAEFEKLKRSIETFGLVELPVWNKRTGNVVGGHQRLSVMKSLGYAETDVMVVDLPDAEEKALNVALNKISGEWDTALLTDLMFDLKSSGFDIELTGFDLAEAEKLLADADESEVKDDDFDIDGAAKEPPFVLRGDIWTLGGKHRLMCGDSTSENDVARLMNDNKANLLLTDPPFGVSYSGKAGKIANDDLRGDDLLEKLLLPVFKNAAAALDDDASAYVFHADTQGEWFRKAFRLAGFHLSGVCQWVKPSLVLGRSPYQYRNEPVLFGWKEKGKHRWLAGRAETTVWEFAKPKKNDIHPTMKPLDLLAYPIKNSTAANAIVLDLFSGSFSTGMTCEQTNRICYAMEIDEKYASASVKRFSKEYSAENVTVERDGKVISYKNIIKNLEDITHV